MVRKAHMDNQTSSSSLQPISSIFTAETYALHLAVSTARRNNVSKFVIFSDSRSVLQAICQKIPKDTKIRKLKHAIFEAGKEGRQIIIELCWIPGHAAIQGNEKVDQLAKLASTREAELEPCPYKDTFTHIYEEILHHWNQKWTQETNNGLREIKNIVFQWKEAKQNRRMEVVLINRLRTGHTHLTHSYLMKGIPIPPPCELCGTSTMTIKHLLTQRNNLKQTKITIFGGDKPTVLEEFLGEN